MNTAISEYLTNVSETHKVNILYAAESGSRAWGFASPNSDYDIRFIYARPIEHYLRFNVELQRDVLELRTGNPLWDVSGWDIRKALELFTRSNGTLLEWLRSPLHYIDPHPAIETLRTLARDHFNPTALCYHYYRMGKNNAREFLRGNSVSLKKYSMCYVHSSRWILSVRRKRYPMWISEHSLQRPAVSMRRLPQSNRKWNRLLRLNSRLQNSVKALGYRYWIPT